MHACLKSLHICKEACASILNPDKASPIAFSDPKAAPFDCILQVHELCITNVKVCNDHERAEVSGHLLVCVAECGWCCW